MTWKILITDGIESTGKEILTQECIVDDKKGIEAAELLRSSQNMTQSSSAGAPK